ncbi:MAG: PAS domain S-box protein, partial [Bacteroidota bacterium]|nr:PAS domain S-box protein [Bacteroidota bacterium]
LQKSQEKYHTIFNNAIVGICLFDTAGKVTFYNKLMSKHMGQPGSNLTGKTLIEILGEKGYPFHEHVLSVLRGDGRQDYEETTTISGMVCWFNSSYDPIINASGKIIGVQEITRDITKRRLAEKALQESEELYRKLVSASPDGIVVIDLQGKISIISDKCLKLMHISSQEELIGTGILQWVAEEDINKAKENLNQVVQTGSNTDQDFTVVLKDGTRILTEVNASLVNTLNESTPKVILVIRDITEWKETEKRMIQLSRAVRQVPASVVITDYKREIVYVNPQFCQSIGSTFTELQGKKIRSLSSVQALNTDYSKIIDTINSGHEWKGEIKRKNKNGATIVEFIHISPVFDEKNKITHFLEIIEDITELRQAEEKIKKYTDQLRALSSHNEKVREDERLNLAREIHDILGVSLSGIIMHLQVLKKSLSGISVKDPDINHQIDHIMKMASESVNSMRNLVRGIRPDSLEELGFVEAVLAFISELQSKTKLKFKISVIPEEIIIKTEKAIILFRVFQEVITNILNHSQATNVSILIKKEHRHLCLKIKDNGIGIKLNDLEKKTSFGIMGIKERMILLKGKVEFIGSASKGTTVNIDLPLY